MNRAVALFAGACLVALLVGFVASLPFQTSSFGGEIATATGLPINGLAVTLHYADFAYVVGFAVAFVIYRLGTRQNLSTAA